MIRKLRKRFGRRLQAIFIKWTSKLFLSSSATTSSFPDLPNEVIQYILDQLYYDTPTLLSCALVARAFAIPSQRGIFREIILEFPPRVRRYESARTVKTKYKLLTRSFREIDAAFANPRLASYVQSLKLYNFGYYSDGEAIVGSLHATAARIVHRLSKVNKLYLSNVDWSYLSLSLKSALTDIVRAPSLTQVYLSDFHRMFTFAELSSLLGHATHLKVLYVENDWIIWQSSSILQSHVEESGASRSIQLDQLRFPVAARYMMDGFLTWLQQDSCPFDVRNLRLLRIGSNQNNPSAPALMRYIGRNLRELELLEMYMCLPADVIPFEYTPNLRNLRLHTINGPFCRLEVHFERLLHPDVETRLRHLTINVWFYSPGTLSDWKPCEEWAALDKILEKPEFFLLETVHIRLIARGIPNDVKESFRRTLSYLEGSGKLILNVG